MIKTRPRCQKSTLATGAFDVELSSFGDSSSSHYFLVSDTFWLIYKFVALRK